MQTDSDLDLDTAGWHPRIARLLRYWRAIRPPDLPLPGRQHFDPIAVPELLPGIWLLDVQREPFRLRYRLAGTGVVAACRREVTGLWLDQAHPGAMETLDFVRRYRGVVERGEPDRRKGKSRPWIDPDYPLSETLLLPLARDGRRVDMLCACAVLYRRDGSVAF